MKNFDSTRQYLKTNGWHRCDRTNNGKTQELWAHADLPNQAFGGRSVSYHAAMRWQKKWDLAKGKP